MLSHYDLTTPKDETDLFLPFGWGLAWDFVWPDAAEATQNVLEETSKTLKFPLFTLADFSSQCQEAQERQLNETNHVEWASLMGNTRAPFVNTIIFHLLGSIKLPGDGSLKDDPK